MVRSLVKGGFRVDPLNFCAILTFMAALILRYDNGHLYA